MPRRWSPSRTFEWPASGPARGGYRTVVGDARDGHRRRRSWGITTVDPETVNRIPSAERRKRFLHPLRDRIFRSTAPVVRCGSPLREKRLSRAPAVAPADHCPWRDP